MKTKSTAQRPRRVRTLGLPDTPERAAVIETYDAYVKAQRLAILAHNAWRHVRRVHGRFAGYDDNHRAVKAARTKAATAAKRRAEAKTAYRQARAAAATREATA